MENLIKSPFYKTGKFYYHDGGSMAVKTEIEEQVCYELLIEDDEVLGLITYKNNNCGGQRYDNTLLRVANLMGKNLKMYQRLMADHEQDYDLNDDYDTHIDISSLEMPVSFENY